VAAYRMPSAEVEVSADLVVRLLAAQHPDLAQLPVTVLAHGWDNVVCRVGEQLLARMPRRELSAGLLIHEQRWLPVLAPGLPLPVPAPVRTGRPDLGYPWSWSIVPFLPGRVAAQDPPADLLAAAVRLGKFLAALHAKAPPDAPVNVVRGVPLRDRSTSVAQNLVAAGVAADRDAVLALWEACVATPRWSGPPVWLHGDLHPANIVVHEGRVSGVVDFGDLTSGDPAADLSAAWTLLPPASGREAFREAYVAAGGPGADDDTWIRARGWALALSLVFLAHSADNPMLAGIGRRTMDAVIQAP
jgi:aminoglycoside phosphotransferase (APT) family kinase protein